MYDKKHKQIKEKQHDLSIQLDEFTKADDNYHVVVSMVLNLAQRAREIFESSELSEKRELLKFILQNPVVKDKKLAFTLREPFNLVAETARNTPLLRRQDSNLRPSA